MAKRNEEQIQNPEEEQLENISQEVDKVNGGDESVVEESLTDDTDTPEATGISIMVSQTKDGESKVAETLDEGWKADGVAIVDGSETLLVVALNESQLAFGGDESQDLEEDVASPSMTGLDGQQRSAFLIEFYQREEKAVPALSACAEYGWLPSGGEMALIFANKAAINTKIEAIGGATIGDGNYWTSQRFSNDRMWHCYMNDGTFGIAIGTKSVAAVRPVKK